ncbi:septum formation inhibitor Maf [Constantimarinum furrinae]|uniref:Septum formation inhibitor Maf n=1 Tax=Constantimarinum furrinae TaxID=2562285 RepID=A0A7G8PW73_9FLAO|nr:septum formation inhibitor Maf [Constantimarinum furrinae]QNJ98589.1 septum formation inhibitor Maf [Constantimarinum furrinae]
MKLLRFPYSFVFLSLMFIWSCADSEKNLIPLSSDQKETKKEQNERNLTEEFKSYWYNGTAELTSYSLVQERYGELREGTSVNIFVTEDFLRDEQVKANNASEETISVLKLNNTKNFITGIYPYSVMTSTFSPITNQGHALKVSHSVQEWCGQVYMQLNNRDDFEITTHSYFAGEADMEVSLQQSWLENELWNLIRIDPNELPTGDIHILPSFEYMRFHHKKPEIHTAFASLKQGDSLSIYSVNYPELQRQITWYFNSTFPYEIEQWEETNAGRENDTSRLKTTAVKLKRMRSAYWRQNNKKDEILRDSLAL